MIRWRACALSGPVLLVLLLSAGCGEPAPVAVVAEVAIPPASPPPSPPTTEAAPEPTPPASGVLITRTGVVVPILARVDDGWRVRSPCGDEVLVSGGSLVQQATVVLDPGHGGPERGAVSPDGLAEGPLNLDVSRRAQEALEAEGVTVIFTRTAEYEVSLDTRGEIARSLQPRAFVSLHHNAAPDGPSQRPGTETYYQVASTDSKRLAGLIYEEVFLALSEYDADWASDDDAGAKYRPGRNGDYYSMLRLPAPVTSVLVESAFISNPAESELLARDEVRQAEAEAVARGILRYLNTDDPGSGYVEPNPRTSPDGGDEGEPCADPAL